MTRPILILAVAAGLLSTALHAAPSVVVEAVQYPAWLERGGRSVPLTPGTTLQAADRVRTGESARVQLKLSEGSSVKLGEKAQFVIERIEDKGIFKAALSVLTGAFRFTTDALKKKIARDVSIRVKNVTAGVRGTDLWGKSGEERDIVCLLEGRISVGAQGHPTVTLDNPLDFYQKPRDGKPEVAKVDAKQVEVWSAETEIAKEGGAAAHAGGRWRVVIGLYGKREPALDMSRRLRLAGYPAELTLEAKRYTVAVPGLAGEPEARTLMASMRLLDGIASPLVQETPQRH